ncbi:MAG: phosphoenolpyruvate carboxykinase (ATP), partial [Nitrospinota bacterium]
SAPRMKLDYTRAMLRAALDGELEGASYASDPVFGIQVPERCPGVPGKVLRPREAWSDKAAYDAKARELAAAFAKNFSANGFDTFKSQDWADIQAAGPRVG